MIIDIHTHVYPDKIAEKASASIGSFYGIPMSEPSGSLTLLHQIAAESGIDRFVIHSVATTEAQVQSINNFIAGAVLSEPGLFIGFATMHPDYAGQAAELERAVGLGLRGLKLHPDFQRFAITDPRMDETYAFCQDAGLPILFHTGDHRYTYSNPPLVPELLARFPRLKLICAHFGGWSEWDKALACLPGTGVYVDCSSSFFALTDEQIMAFIRAYGADRVLFGSDFPMWNSARELQRLRSLPLTDEELRLIEYENAVRLLGLTPAELGL